MMDAVKKSQGAPSSPQQDQSGRREMRGPGIDIGSMMGGFMPPPPPTNTRPVFREDVTPVASEIDDVSDIVSVNSDTKDLTIKTGKKKTSKKKEVTI